MGIFAFLAVIGLAPAKAQYLYNAWTAADGLPQNIVRGVQQDKNGYLWIATLNGLARFDGVRFTIYNRRNTPEITSNRFNSLVESKDGALWLDTELGGITRYSDGVFRTFGTESGIDGNRTEGLTEDDAGNIWVLTGGRIKQWDAATQKFVPIAGQDPGDHYIPLLWQGGFWSSDGKGIHCFFRGKLSYHALPDWLRGDRLWAAAMDQNGNVWVEDHNRRQARLVAGAGAFEDIPMNAQGTSSFVDHSGRSWTVHVIKYLRRTIKYRSGGRDLEAEFANLFEDREHNLWIGTEGHGLVRLLSEVVTTYSAEEGLAGRNVYPVLQDHTGAMWMGVWAGGLSRFAGGHFTNFRSGEELRNGQITALAEDHLGRIWVGQNDHLELFVDGRHKASPDLPLPRTAVVQAIHEDRKGTMWFGTSLGVLAYSASESHLLTTANGLATDDVRVIIEDASGDLWFGGYGGLSKLHAGQITHWQERDGLASNNVRALYRDADGALWIGTYDRGLTRFKDGHFTRYSTADGLFDEGVFQILEDKQGNLWMSCNRGIYRVTKRELNEFADGKRDAIFSVAYGKADGMRNVECNGGYSPAGTLTREGEMWFPTQDGVAIIRPETVASNIQLPPVMIESALIDRVPVSTAAPLQMKADAENLEILYTALSFVDSPQIRFRYKMEGLDSQWTDAGSRRTAYYSHPRPGTYTFHVIAGNRDGIWNTEGQRIEVTVFAPFYRTLWFYTLLLALAALTLWLLWRRRDLQHRKVEELQRAFSSHMITSQENERKRIAAELHDSIGQRLVVINNLALIALQDRQHEPATGSETNRLNIIQEIGAEAQSAIRETREISYDLRPFQLDRLGLTKGIAGIVRSTASASGITISSDIDNIDDFLPVDTRINLYRIVQESLNNILKHAQATLVKVTLRRDDDEGLVLSIEDNGRGFTPGNAESLNSKGGAGLTGMEHRARLLGGEFHLRSAAGKGTIITVQISKRGT